ncbi:hypothetical protein [Anaerococcus obesiensis]|nr:hypothetical protein [Anaerococcus obesiensis]
MIEFKDVSFTYDSGNKNAGIYNINLNINAGEVVVFVVSPVAEKLQ